MNKKEIVVPGNIRYITEWKEFMSNNIQLPCIIDKQLTGCGFTEWCLCNNLNVVLCSPRKILLENKEQQHTNDILYAKNENEKQLEYDKNLNAIPKDCKTNEDLIISNIDSINHFKSQVKSWAMHKIIANNEPCKILVTYDSFKFVKEALQEEGFMQDFLVVIDEWQSIFVDSRFKSTTEMELLNQLQDLKHVMYVSATPMIDKYIQRIPEFKDIPYYTLNWEKENPYRIIHPDLEVKKIFNNTSITSVACDIIEKYRKGDYDKLAIVDKSGNPKMIYSMEAVFYVNSVKNISDIIKKSGMKKEECNILCANTPDNLKKIKQVLGITRGDKEFEIGKVPARGQKHKMFTFCTRTVYLGADFYSTNAKSYIFSDANVDSLSVDITLDLPQILGRQRLEENPWKNRATLYYKVIKASNEETLEEFEKRIQEKLKKTDDLLRSYTSAPNDAKHTLASTYQYVAKTANYKDNYVAVDTRAGKDLIPVANLLVQLADERTHEIQQIDFKDRFSVFCQVEGVGSKIINKDTVEVENFLEEFNNYTKFTDKMRMFCTTKFSSDKNRDLAIRELPENYRNYILYLPPEKILSVGCQKSKLDYFLNDILNNSIVDKIYSLFKLGEKYTCLEIKKSLSTLYSSLGYNKTPKATDLEEYFELKDCQVIVDGKKTRGYLILKQKEL